MLVELPLLDQDEGIDSAPQNSRETIESSLQKCQEKVCVIRSSNLVQYIHYPRRSIVQNRRFYFSAACIYEPIPRRQGLRDLH